MAHKILGRVLFYGVLLLGIWWWTLWTPGYSSRGPQRALSAHEAGLQAELRSDVETLAGQIGERNVPFNAQKLEEAAQFIDASMRTAGYQPQSQWYRAGGANCRNLEVEIRGASRPEEIVIVGAHYDSAPDSPGADDNASGVAAMLALARHFATAQPQRTLRFVGFANEEPPYFWHEEMGSLVYAKRCRERAEHIVAMLSLESVGVYSNAPGSQQYPLGLGLLYPSKADFVAFVGNVHSRSLVHRAIASFRNSATLPSIGAALPNAIPGVGWSDHWAFWQQGFPGIEITDTALFRNPLYHTPGDTPRRLDYDRLARFTSAMEVVIGELVNVSQ